MGSLREHIYDTIHRNEKPLKLIAEETSMSENYLTRTGLPDHDESETGSGCNFPLKKLIPVIKSTDDYQIVDHIEESLGRVAYRLPRALGALNDVVRLSMVSIREFGELMSSLEQGIADGRLTDKERSMIAKEGYEAVQAIVSLLKGIEKQYA